MEKQLAEVEVHLLTNENKPQDEVIALDGYGEALVGYVTKKDEGILYCESDESFLNNVTHFIKIPNFHGHG